MVTRELVLQLGVEGGGICIYRTVLDGGAYQFHGEGVSMILDDNDEEMWRSWETSPVETIEAALRLIAQGGSWIYGHPISVLDEYKSDIWQHVQDTQRSVAQGSPDLWERSRQHWMEACSPE